MKAALLPLLLSATPGAELVDSTGVVPGLVLDMRYATERNFFGAKLYPVARCALRRDVAERLARVQAALAKEGLGLKVFDCYRPLSVQKELWKRFPRPGYVQDPKKGSNHNRAAAVDVSLIAAAGEDLPMPTDHDAFVREARHGAKVAPALAKNRDRLKAAMEAEGFRPIKSEWWHYDAPEALGALVLDVPLDAVPAAPARIAAPAVRQGNGDGG